MNLLTYLLTYLLLILTYLLLIEVARRERPQLSVHASAAAAVRKLRRPRQYVSRSNPSPNLVLLDGWVASPVSKYVRLTYLHPPGRHAVP